MTHRELFGQVLADRPVESLPRPTPRLGRVLELPGKASALVGMRRTGKTWRMFQDLWDRLDEGVPPGQLLYIDFEDDRLPALTGEDLHVLPEVHRAMHPDVAERPLHLYLDEVQNVPGWERFVRRHVETGHRVWVTGSSARLLSREVATSLRGRALTTEVFPYSFAEVARGAGWEVASWPPGAADRARLEALTRSYLRVGGFPEVQGVDDVLRPAVLQDYVDVVVLRDVVERHGVVNLPALRYLVARVLEVPGGRLSVHKVYNDLRSQGQKVSKDLLHAVLKHLEDAYLLGVVALDTPSLARRSSNPRKVYPIDPGLAVAHSLRAAGNHGHLLETATYWELRRRGFSCAYGKTTSGFEVDFVARRPGREEAVGLVQVSWDASDAATRQRELRALEEAMGEQGVETSLLLTLAEAGEERVSTGVVEVLPFSWWACGSRP